MGHKAERLAPESGEQPVVKKLVGILKETYYFIIKAYHGKN